MNFTEKDLMLAQKNGIISSEIFIDLLNYLKTLHSNDTAKLVQKDYQKEVQNPTQVKFTMENFFYYFGAFIIINTMGWYMANSFQIFGHGGLLALSIIYFIIFTIIGNLLWHKGKTTPGGLLYVCAVSVIPIGVWSMLTIMGIMPDEYDKYSDFHIFVRSGYILMELATVLGGCLFLKYRKFPLLTLPICYATWYLSMDIVPLCLGHIQDPTWGMRNFASLVFSLIMLGFALKYDRKTEGDYSGWLYIFGSTMLWGVIISLINQFKLYNEAYYFTFALFSFAYMFISVIVKRKVFMVWGAIGFFGYLSRLAYTIFKDSSIFPLILVLIGLEIIFIGIYYAKNCDKIEQKLRKLILNE